MQERNLKQDVIFIGETFVVEFIGEFSQETKDKIEDFIVSGLKKLALSEEKNEVSEGSG